jgi:hypothetical protein
VGRSAEECSAAEVKLVIPAGDQRSLRGATRCVFSCSMLVRRHMDSMIDPRYTIVVTEDRSSLFARCTPYRLVYNYISKYKLAPQAYKLYRPIIATEISQVSISFASCLVLRSIDVTLR